MTLSVVKWKYRNYITVHQFIGFEVHVDYVVVIPEPSNAFDRSSKWNTNSASNGMRRCHMRENDTY